MFARAARVAAFCLITGPAVFGQTSSSTISGVIHDTSGAVVPGATVRATHDDTGVSSAQASNEAGLFSFPSLPAGSYTLSAELQGFKTTRKPKNALAVGTTLSVDLVLEVGEAADVVSVDSRYDSLQISDASIGNVVSQKEIVEMPLNGRNPLALLVLEPGVVQRSNGAAGTGIHVNGSRDMASNTTIDGIDANESSVPNPVSNVYRLTPDNVQEYKVTTSNASAEQGRNSGASISVATRSGTNRFHGTAYDFFRNTALNSNEFFANALGTPKPEIKLNQYGFELGGPIRRNRTFFFGSWQDQKINFAQPVDQVYTGVPLVYTPEALSGAYRYFRADPKTAFALNGQTITRNTPLLVDPYTGAVRPGVRTCGSDTDLNCIASYNMFANDPQRIGADPVVANLLHAIPAANSYSVGDGLNTAGYLWNPPVRKRGATYMGRVDHTFDANNTFFARYLQGANNTLGGDPNNNRPQLFPGFPPLGEVYRLSKNLAVSYRRVVTPRIVNELTLGVSRFDLLFTQGEANPDFLNVAPYSRAQGTAFNNIDSPYRNVPRTQRIVTTPQILDNLSFVRGAHSFKTGFNFRFYRHDDRRGAPGASTVTPLLTFDRVVRAPSGFNTPAVASTTTAGINSTDSGRLLGSINDLLGIPARLSQTFLGDLAHDAFLPFRSGDSITLWNQGIRRKQYNFYFQDEWKLRRNVTLNAGVRWEINARPTEASGRVYVPDKPIDGSQGAVTFVKADSWMDRKNFDAVGPRIGLTWSPGGRRTVIRTGYAMAFDTISSFQITAVAGSVPGLTLTCSAIPGGAVTPGCPSVPNLRIAQGFPSELAVPSLKPSDFLKLPAQLQPGAPAVNVFDPNLKVPTVHQWNFTVQHELPGEFTGQIAYVGRRGTRLYRGYDLNQTNADPILPSFLAMQGNIARGCRADGTTCPSGVTGASIPIVASGLVTAAFVNTTTTAGDLNLNAAGTFAGRIEQNTLAGRLRPNQQFGTITYLDSGGDSYYHSMQATLRKRFSSGLLFGFAYTFAKSIDDQSVDPVASSSGGGLSTTNARTPTDIRNWRLERGRSDFDRTHVITSTWIYELPFGKGQRFGASAPAAVNQAINGWSINGIATVMSGEPFSVRSGVRTSNNSHESRADIIGPKPEVKLTDVPGIIGPVYFRDVSSFAIPAPGSGGAGRNIFTAPGYWNVDLGVTRVFAISERLKLQFRAEMFNALNHPNLDNPRDASSSSNSYRSTLFGQTCCATVAPSSTQSIVDTGESARVIQLALKLRW
jgi:hypothetical protein